MREGFPKSEKVTIPTDGLEESNIRAAHNVLSLSEARNTDQGEVHNVEYCVETPSINICKQCFLHDACRFSRAPKGK